MIVKKIDANLLKQIEILSLDKKVSCFIFGNNFQKTYDLLSNNNIEILQKYPFINAIYCKATRHDIVNLSKSNNVNYISSLANASSMMFVSKKILQVENTNFTGKTVGVAFIDTGLSPHCDFMLGENRVAIFKDFINNKTEMYDDNGHGTFVTGVCSGNGSLSGFHFCGIAPRSTIFSLKALDGQGEASANKILDAMEWIYDNHKTLGIDVVCMSFGSEPLGVNDPIMLGANSLWKDGVVVVAAAGNSGPEFQTIKSPGVSPQIITVGGIDDNRYDDHTYNSKYFEIAEFSSRGPAFRNIKPDVVAPSVDIVSCGAKTPYTTLSGTSVATPMIAGLCCLIIERDKSLSPNQIKNQLINICQPLGFEMNLEGFGLPNFKKFENRN